jgi:hypothetical protein
VRLAFEGRGGFLRLRSTRCRFLRIRSCSSSRTSLQGKRISEQNPRALFFNDRVALGWVRDGDVIEVAAHDESAGVVFYTLDQRADPATGPPQFKRAFVCLGCHVTVDTLGVPGLLMFSTTRPEPSQFSGVPRHIDQDSPLRQRFGGWFVTGSTGRAPHMGNDLAALDGRPSRELASVEGLFDADGYRALSSDVVAHLVLTHQADDEPAHAVAVGRRPILAATVHVKRRTGRRRRRGDESCRARSRGSPVFIDEAKLTDRAARASPSGFPPAVRATAKAGPLRLI